MFKLHLAAFQITQSIRIWRDWVETESCGLGWLECGQTRP